MKRTSRKKFLEEASKNLERLLEIVNRKNFPARKKGERRDSYVCDKLDLAIGYLGDLVHTKGIEKLRKEVNIPSELPYEDVPIYERAMHLADLLDMPQGQTKSDFDYNLDIGSDNSS